MTAESMKIGQILAWTAAALTGAMCLWLLVPREKFSGVATILLGISIVVDFAWTARSRSRAGQPGKPWELAFFVACGLVMMIAGCMMLLQS